MRSWRNGIRATLRSLWRKLLGGSSPLDRTKDRLEKKLRIIYLPLIILIFLTKYVHSQRFMMNCISPDYKQLAFYKLDTTNNEFKLFKRSMKGRWSNFCYLDNDINKKVICTKNKLSITRLEVEKKQNKTLKSTKTINFQNYGLVERKQVYIREKEDELESDSEVVFKCKKIRI